MIKVMFRPPPIRTEAFRLHGIGVQERMKPGLIDRPHGTGDYLFMLFYNHVQVATSRGIQEAEPCSLIIWPPSQYQHYGHCRESYVHSWIHCDGLRVQRMLRDNAIPTGTIIPAADSAAMEKQLMAILDEVLDEMHPDAVIAGNCLENWLRSVRRRIDSRGSQRRVPKALLRIKRHIETHYEQAITVSQLADMLHVSQPHFCTQFKRHFGIAAMNYVIHLRMSRAAFLLHDHNLRIGEIAARVGYDNIYHFSKLFKKRYGISPANMRRIMCATAAGRQ